MLTGTPADFITVAELKTHLNKASAADDAELAGFVSAACQMIRDRIGHVSPVAAVDLSDGRRHRSIVLTDHPVVSVTTVEVAGGEVIPPADPDTGTDGWELDSDAGFLRNTESWPPGTIRVTYTAGRDPLPGNIRLAALELAGHLWKQSQLNSGGGRPQITGDDQVIMPGLAYALPLRVRELLGLGKNPTNEIVVG